MQDISLTLIPIYDENTNASLGMEPVISQCRVLYPPSVSYSKVPDSQNGLSNVNNDFKEPGLKRRKLNCMNNRQSRNIPDKLCPCEQVSVVAQTPVPEFVGYSAMCCDLVVHWIELVDGTADGVAEMVGDDDGSKETGCEMRERARSCGRVWLSAVDVVRGNLGIDIASSSEKASMEIASSSVKTGR